MVSSPSLITEQVAILCFIFRSITKYCHQIITNTFRELLGYRFKQQNLLIQISFVYLQEVVFLKGVAFLAIYLCIEELVIFGKNWCYDLSFKAQTDYVTRQIFIYVCQSQYLKVPYYPSSKTNTLICSLCS